MSGDPIPDEEVVVRRIAPTSPWFEPPDRVTSANFKLRKGEVGLSVYRLSLVAPERVLAGKGVVAGSFLVAATVGEVRALANAAGTKLGLDVIAADDIDDPGHAEIRGSAVGTISGSASQALRTLFRRYQH